MPVLGMVRRPPRLPSVALVLWPGSAGRVFVRSSRAPLPIIFKLMMSSSAQPRLVGSSTDDMVEESYTLILRPGRASSRGELVMGILWCESSVVCCREEKIGPRNVPALTVRSGGAEECST